MTQKSFNPPRVVNNQIPVGVCRVEATVVSIAAAMAADADPDDPCAKAPCRATLKISRIIGTGSGFNPPLVADNPVQVHFAYTTAATDSLFPDMATHYPGLQPGDILTADLKGSSSKKDSPGGSPAIYTIYGYQKK